jgi:hypothetical protein
MRRIHKIGLLAGFFVVASLGLGSLISSAQNKSETIQANAWGDVRTAGKVFNMTIIINSYSTPEDQKTLIDAFNRGGQQELVKTLWKMKTKGRIAVTGTLGNQIAYVRSFPTETGRKIRILTQRPLKFAEAYYGGRSTSYDVSVVELNINKSDSKKSTGGLIIAARIKVDKKTNQIVVESYGSGPWRLSNIMER